MILTSEPLLLIQKNNMQSLFNSSFGRSHFSKILFQPKFKEYKLHCLANESFNDLFHMIFNALLYLQSSEENVTNFENARLLTKSTFYYYK
jgi:hypothetical protein